MVSCFDFFWNINRIFFGENMNDYFFKIQKSLDQLNIYINQAKDFVLSDKNKDIKYIYHHAHLVEEIEDELFDFEHAVRALRDKLENG